MDARIRFYKITQCGYYDHSNFQFGNIADILENVKVWITGKALNETQTYTVDPDNNESDILRTYCYSIASNSGEYLMTTWNENADVDGKMASMDEHGITGQAAVEAIAPPQGYVPGYPAFFWFLPSHNIFATIQLNTRLNGRKNLDSYLCGFLETRSKYVIFDEEAGNDFKILGYGLSADNFKQLQPRFISTLKKQPGVIDYIKSNCASIRKMIKKDKIEASRNESVTKWQALFRFFNGKANTSLIQSAAKFSIEIERTPSKNELNEIIAQWESDKQNYPFGDVGFNFIRDPQTRWLGHSIASDSFDLDVHYINKNILVDAQKLLSELQRQRDVILKIIHD